MKHDSSLTHYKRIIELNNDTAITDTSVVRFTTETSVPRETRLPMLENVWLTLFTSGVPLYVGPSGLRLGGDVGLRSGVSLPVLDNSA